MTGFQYRKRYELHAISMRTRRKCAKVWFQYRKRYELHAMTTVDTLMRSRKWSFNTASGMNCMQYYGHDKAGAELLRFNTASGMNCMQSPSRFFLIPTRNSFNTASGMNCMQCEVVHVPPSGLPGCFNTVSGMNCMQ